VLQSMATLRRTAAGLAIARRHIWHQVDRLLSGTQGSVAFFHAVKDYCHTEARKKQLLQ